MGTSPSSTSDLARALYANFIAGDRPAMEALLADDFTFTSQYDDHIDKAAYFIRCWPNRNMLRNFEIETLIAEDNTAFVRYTAERVADGVRFRNTEYVVCAAGRVKAVEVYFGAEEKMPR
jgi:ketosteroid isomerase-like protein